MPKAAQVDPITLSTTWNYLNRICREMREFMFRTSPNFLTAKLHDVSVGIWDTQGRAIAIPEGLPGQFIAGGFGIKLILEKYKGRIYPGDVFLTNDPYHGGALHLPDWGFMRPIFYNDELLFMTLARSHQIDTGGAYPGGYFPGAYDIIAEGLNIPPVKVIERGEENTELLRLIWNNTRNPEGVKVDNYALMASSKLCETRMIELLNKYGKDEVLACIEEMFKRTETGMRAAIRAIPDGEYYGEAAQDHDGSVLDVPVWVRLNLIKKDDTITLDWSASDPQTKGFVNSSWANTFSLSMAICFLYGDPELSEYHNEGSMKPFTVIAPEGSVTNPRFPAILGACPVSVGTQIVESILMALSKAVPEKAIAAWGRHYSNFIFGTDPRSNKFYIYVTFNMDGGPGAVYGYDGYQNGESVTTLGSAAKSDIEEEEIRFPWFYRRYEFETDMEGAGKWRGSPGVYWEIENKGDEAMISMGNSQGETTQGAGVMGGYPTPFNRCYVTRGNEQIPYRAGRIYPLYPGDILTKICSGGAGVGNPIERDPEKVLEDVIKEFISIESARDVYKVVINPDKMTVDYEATQKLRAK
ncbi:hydantoinase B/oxoprolinase family protein [Chloroflexota bacterium]